MTLILGIDDAGRGPIVGPMVLAGCLINEKIEQHFRKINVKDSKLLTKEARETIVSEIKKYCLSHHITLTSPDEIEQRNNVGTNLNKLEAIKSAEIINQLNNKIEQINVIVDCPSTNTKAWQHVLEKYIHHKSNLAIHCEHKADFNHIACGAASIIAKTTRDAEIEKIKKSIGIDFGSGYTSDPITIKFLDENFEKYKNQGIFRKTWQTFKDQVKKKEQKNLLDF